MPIDRKLDSRPLPIGWIPYWNLSPLKQEIQRMVSGNVAFHAGHPTMVNRMLSEGVVAAAPCSSVCLLKNPTHEMAAPIGVASSGPVQSVYLGLMKDMAFMADVVKARLQTLREISLQGMIQYGDSWRRVAKYILEQADDIPAKDFDFAPKLRLSTASASSVSLSKIFYRLIFGSNAYDSNVASTLPGANSGLGTMELVIGDEALVRRGEFTKVIDLGQFWHTMTSLPFVFAVWQKTARSCSSGWSNRLTEAAEIAQTRMHVEPTVYYPKNLPLNHGGSEIDLGAYWKNIHYRLNAKDINGLLLYLCLTRMMVKADVDDATVVRMLRWQQMGEIQKSALA